MTRLLTVQHPELPALCFSWPLAGPFARPRTGLHIPLDPTELVAVYVDTWDNRRHVIARTSLAGAIKTKELIDACIDVSRAVLRHR